MSEANTNPSPENLVPFTSIEEDINSEAKAVPVEAKEKDIDWHKLAHKLREQNRKLLKQVLQLEQSLIESDRSLEEQKEISQRQDSFAAKQAAKINSYQEEIDEILHKIESHEQGSLKQKAVIETLTQELETSQQKVSELQEECTELMVYTEAKEQELQETKQQLQELNIRYQRQQQHLLRSKTTETKQVSSQPIKAWSADSSVTKPPASTAKKPKKNSDWFAPAIAKKNQDIESIAAVQLPKFSRKAE